MSKLQAFQAPMSFLPNGLPVLAPGVFRMLHSKASTRSYYSGFIKILAPGPPLFKMKSLVNCNIYKVNVSLSFLFLLFVK